MKQSLNEAGEFRGAHAPRVLVLAPRRNILQGTRPDFLRQVREREGALASTRGACAPRTRPVRALRFRCALS
jgi:hypothetical protein